ncbi:CHAT domain-containing protein [Romeria aff. gracilis LEGE 07310]|uniref:CHAT domain-containing protein n=1 Tax=Vasconcelosia minhoensis LEGE 07310 TaxID=915328 RepID=A0A8J7AWV2_9CYAN|nr:CHAT domain-containing tetratricopeptide repeat protein [Romeria gracilis]MBE9080364.1 CHAT domain-containing protein [Romeria aff. gracilis LEGE 07310]
MKQAVMLFSLVAVNFLLSSASIEPSFSKATGKMRRIEAAQSKQTDESATVLLEVEGVLEEGDAALSDGSLYDVYEVEGQAGQSITIHLESEAFDTYVLFMNTNGELIDESDDVSNQNTNSQLSVIFANDGVYKILANSYDNTGRGRYQLRVTEASQSEINLAEAHRFLNQGLQQDYSSQYQEALQSFQQALALYQNIDDQRGEAVSLSNIGGIYLSLGQYERSIEFLQQASAIDHAIGYLPGEAVTLGRLGLAYESLGRYERAIEFYQQALKITREINDRSSQASILSNMSLVYHSLSQFDRAIELQQQALSIAHEIGDHLSELNALGNLGLSYASLGQYGRAIDFHLKALTIAIEINNFSAETTALGNLGLNYHSLGRYESAIDYLQQFLNNAQRIGDRQREANAFSSLGIVYRSLGQYDQAIDLFQKYLSITREIGDRQGVATALSNIGFSHYYLNQYALSIDAHNQSIEIARTIGDRQGEASSLGGIAIAYSALGQHQKSIELHQQALTTAREIGDRQGVLNNLANIGNTYLALEEFERAIEFYQQSLVMTREIGDRSGEAIALTNLGIAYVSLSDFGEAEPLLRQAIEIHEDLRANLSDNQLISLLDVQFGTFAVLELAISLQGRPNEALEVAEQSRARAFALQLAKRLPNLSESRSSENNLNSAAPTIAGIQKIAYEANTTLVTYSTIGNQILHIWVIRPSGNIGFRSIDFSSSDYNPITTLSGIDGPLYRGAEEPSELSNLVAETRSASLNVISTETEQLKELHQILIDPIADLLPTDPADKVAFIPQGSLFLVPFAALQDEEGTYLVEKHTILTAPSIQVFGLAHDAAQAQSALSTDDALIVGNPVMPEITVPTDSGELSQIQLASLPGAGEEAKAIAQFLNTQPLTGNEATEARVKQLLPSAGIIHLATHGLLDYGDPKTSGVRDLPGAVALAPGSGEDGLLTSAEIYDMNLQANLAILSACDTGRGRITGDGVVGLSRSLITAGVPSVIVSLWSVPDAPTAELMTEFYRQLREGQDKAQALRQAMLATMAEHPNPRDWAAFTLIGNGL